MNDELEHKKVQTKTYDLVIQTIAILLFIGLLVIDKGMGLMKTPIPDLWYGVIGAFGIGGVDLLKTMLKR